MASEVTICNVALSHLGDTASVTSISPPEGSAQAEHCARFYPLARDVLLEAHTWKFCTRRDALALLTETNDQWLYVYAVPNLMLQAISVIPPDAADDYCITTTYVDTYGAPVLPNMGTYAPQPFAIETLSTGTQVILTNQEDAVLRYTVSITDTTQFSSAFTMALTWLLASMLAGPIIKGDVGAAEGKRCYQMFQAHLSAAILGDTDQRGVQLTHVVPWLAGR